MMRIKNWGLMVLLLGIAGVCAEAADETMLLEQEADRGAVAELRKEINLLNLINGLQLTHEQAKKFHALAVKADAARAIVKRAAAADVKVAREEFGALLKVVANNERISKSVQRRANKANKKIKDRRENMLETIKALEKKLLAELTEGQKLILESYKNCLIPKPNLKDPTRVGQANAENGIVKILRRLRRAPAGAYEKQKEKIFERHMKAIEKHQGERTPAERIAEKKRMMEIVAEARAMSDTDFEFEKERLAAAVKPKNKIEEAVKAMGKLTSALGKPGKAARLFLAPISTKVLAERVALLAAPASAEKTDLAKIKAADSCADGKCAIDGPGNLAKGKFRFKKPPAR